MSIGDDLTSALSGLGSVLCCAICMCTVVDAVSLDCHHIFCSECIAAVVTCNASLRDSLECPVCRGRTQKRTVQPDQLVRNVASIINKLTAALQRSSIISAATPPSTPLTCTIQEAKHAHSVDEAHFIDKATPTKLRRGRSESRRGRSTSFVADDSASYSHVKSDEAKTSADDADTDTDTSGPICAVCYERDDDELHVCDECGVCVHSECYGIDDDENGNANAQWRCDVCVAGERAPECFACHNDADRAYKVTDDNAWMHVSCALWHEGPKFADIVHRTPITDADTIDRARFKLKCKFCRRSGACVQCTYGKCAYAYHVTCGLRNDIQFEMRPGDGDDVFFHSFCPKHKALSHFVESDNSHVRRKRKSSHNSNTKQANAKRRATSLQKTNRQTNSRRSHLSESHTSALSKDPFLFELSPSLPVVEIVILPTQLHDADLTRLHRLLHLAPAARLVSSWSGDVTHVITPTTINSGGRMEKRTMKYLLGIAAGKPVLCIDWLNASLDSGTLVAVDDYLVQADKVANNGAIKRFHCKQLIFDQMTFTLIGKFSKSSFVNEVKLIVTSGGGNVIDYQRVMEDGSADSLVLLYENNSNREWLEAAATVLALNDNRIAHTIMSTTQLFDCISHGQLDRRNIQSLREVQSRIHK